MLTRLVPWIKNLAMKIGSAAGGRAEGYFLFKPHRIPEKYVLE
jgi:hypothetical protein